MLNTLRCAVVFGALGIAVLACTAGSTSATNSAPQKQAQVTSPTSGLSITATISAVTLGEECGAGTSGGVAAPSQGDCAPIEAADSGTTDGGSAGKAAPGCGGTSYCQQSNVQIAFTAGTGTKNAKVEIVSVRLLESASGKVVDTLKASHPQSWTGTTYASWDESIKPAGELKASYDLTAPAWSTLSGTSDSRAAYSTQYKLNVTLLIDGVEITLESTDLSREPAVAT